MFFTFGGAKYNKDTTTVCNRIRVIFAMLLVYLLHLIGTFLLLVALAGGIFYIFVHLFL